MNSCGNRLVSWGTSSSASDSVVTLATIACVAATLGTLVGGPLLLAYAGPTTSEQCYEINQAHDESRWC